MQWLPVASRAHWPTVPSPAPQSFNQQAPGAATVTYRVRKDSVDGSQSGVHVANLPLSECFSRVPLKTCKEIIAGTKDLLSPAPLLVHLGHAMFALSIICSSSKPDSPGGLAVCPGCRRKAFSLFCMFTASRAESPGTMHALISYLQGLLHGAPPPLLLHTGPHGMACHLQPPRNPGGSAHPSGLRPRAQADSGSAS